jgi:hypothetical protein
MLVTSVTFRAGEDSKTGEQKSLRLGGLPGSKKKVLRSANLRTHGNAAGVFNRIGGKNHVKAMIHWDGV